MKSTIVDEVGVEMAGPDDPALVRAEVREGRDAVVRVGSVGGVAPEQAGLLGQGVVRGTVTAPVQITDDMVRRGHRVGVMAHPDLDPLTVREILTAALQPR